MISMPTSDLLTITSITGMEKLNMSLSIDVLSGGNEDGMRIPTEINPSLQEDVINRPPDLPCHIVPQARFSPQRMSTDGGPEHVRDVTKTKENYCDSCLSTYHAPDWPKRLRQATRYLHCSRCNAHHPACLFSRIQRQVPKSVRYCIGHEGYLRICEHRTVSWLQIINKSQSIMRHKFGYRYRTITCKDSSHTTDSKHHHSRKYYPTLTIGYKDTKDFYITLSWGPHLPLEDNGTLTHQTFEKIKVLAPLVQAQTDSATGRMNMDSLMNRGVDKRKEKEKKPEKHSEGSGIQKVRALRCSHRKDCIQLKYTWRWKAGGSHGANASFMGKSWFDVLDPDSYKLTQDEDGKGVYWCGDKDCRNYYRYTHSRLQPLLGCGDYRRPCSK